MGTRWTDFVKQWAKKHDMAYGCALSNADMKKEYYKVFPKAQQEKFMEAKERETMGQQDKYVPEKKRPKQEALMAWRS